MKVCDLTIKYLPKNVPSSLLGRGYDITIDNCAGNLLSKLGENV